MTPSTPWTSQDFLTVGCVLSVFAAAGYLAYRSGKKHRQRLKSFSRETGWALTRGDEHGIKEKLDELFPAERFGVAAVMVVETGRRRIYLVDGSYCHNNATRSVYLATVCLVESERFGQIDAPVEVCARSWLDAKFLSDQVSMGDGDFAAAFIVQSKAPGSADRVLNAPIQQAFVEYAQMPLSGPVQTVIDSGRMALLMEQPAQPECWRDLVELARKVESRS